MGDLQPAEVGDNRLMKFYSALPKNTKRFYKKKKGGQKNLENYSPLLPDAI